MHLQEGENLAMQREKGEDVSLRGFKSRCHARETQHHPPLGPTRTTHPSTPQRFHVNSRGSKLMFGSYIHRERRPGMP